MAKKIIFIILGIVIPISIIIVYLIFDMGALFDSWQNKEANPDWKYIFLILFKLNIYIFPPLIGMIGFYNENKMNIKKNKFIYYYSKALNFHFLILLCIKLIASTLLELDSIWNLTIFNSINEVQMLVGYIFTLFLGQNIKVEPGLEASNAFKKIEKKEEGEL